MCLITRYINHIQHFYTGDGWNIWLYYAKQYESREDAEIAILKADLKGVEILVWDTRYSSN